MWFHPLLVQAILSIIEFWKRVDSEIEKILVEGNLAFLQPKEYVNLLHDDPNSRARLYFWASGILPELVATITQNIVELKSFDAKMTNYRRSGNRMRTPITLIEQCRRLETIMRSFERKLTLVKELRDVVSKFPSPNLGYGLADG